MREFPRLPLYSNFRRWAEIGQRLLDLHIAFESVEPYPPERVEREGVEPPDLRCDRPTIPTCRDPPKSCIIAALYRGDYQ